MKRFLISLAFLSQTATAAAPAPAPIQTQVTVTTGELFHLTLHANAANTDKPVVLIFDKTFPKTQQNGGVIGPLEAGALSSEILHTQGPIQLHYYDFDARKLIPCGEGISQFKGDSQLVKINVDINYAQDQISCHTTGDYVKTDPSTKGAPPQVARLNELR